MNSSTRSARGATSRSASRSTTVSSTFLNAGGAGNITGFTFSRSGDLSALAGSSRPLSGSGTGPAQVSFDPEGELLVVTEKNTNLIDVYEVGDNGRASGSGTHPSSGATPFGRVR